MSAPTTATAWLEKFLSHGPKPTSEIRDAALAAHFNWVTIRHAAELLLVEEPCEDVWALADQQQVEVEAEEAFALYCALGAQRSLDAVARRIGIGYRAISGWSRRHRWRERVLASEASTRKEEAA